MLNIIFAGILGIFTGNPDSTSIQHDSVPLRTIIISNVVIEGNKVTKRPIVLREMIVKTGDTLDTKVLEEKLVRCRQNLLNTSLFNFVTITQTTTDSLHYVINVSLKEGWYIWPAPVFEIVDRNVNVWWQTKDLSRVNYGLDVTQYNFRGRNETVVAGFRSGYTQAFQLGYSIPYLSRKQKQGIGAYASYQRTHEIPFTTYNNKLIFLRTPDFIRHVFDAAIKYSYREKIYTVQSVQLGYRNYAINDTVVKRNADFFINGQKKQEYFSLVYNYRRDRRDLKAYPLQGYYYEFLLSKVGLGVLNHEIDLTIADFTYKKFWHLYKRFYYAARGTVEATLNGKHSFSTLSALGYDDQLVRGYEYYVIKGEHFGLFQSNLKFVLMKQKILKLKFIPTEKFNTIPNSLYLNLNFDAAYVYDNLYQKYNSLANQVIYGYGLGLDYATYYSTVIRVEYSINKFAEAGIFLHFTIPI